MRQEHYETIARNMAKAQFDSDLERAKRAEAELDDALVKMGFSVIPATREQEKSEGIDRIVFFRINRGSRDEALFARSTLEYKSDFMRARTGNFFLEISRHHQDASNTIDPGWARKSVAQAFVFHSPQLGVACFVDGWTIKTYLRRWLETFPTAMCDDLYVKIFGVLVPAEELHAVAYSQFTLPKLNEKGLRLETKKGHNN